MTARGANFRTESFRVAVMNTMRRWNMSRHDLTAVTGLHHDTVKRFLTSTGPPPSLGVVIDLADACDLNVDDFRMSRQLPVEPIDDNPLSPGAAP